MKFKIHFYKKKKIIFTLKGHQSKITVKTNRCGLPFKKRNEKKKRYIILTRHFVNKLKSKYNEFLIYIRLKDNQTTLNPNVFLIKINYSFKPQTYNTTIDSRFSTTAILNIEVGKMAEFSYRRAHIVYITLVDKHIKSIFAVK